MNDIDERISHMMFYGSKVFREVLHNACVRVCIKEQILRSSKDLMDHLVVHVSRSSLIEYHHNDILDGITDKCRQCKASYCHDKLAILSLLQLQVITPLCDYVVSLDSNVAQDGRNATSEDHVSNSSIQFNELLISV